MIKQYWLVYNKKDVDVQLLSFKEMEDVKLRTKFYFDNELTAKNYLTYLNNRRMED